MPLPISSSPDAWPTICVAGAGAIGLTLAARLALSGHRVSVVARGESLSAINRDGIRLIDLDGDHRVKVQAVRAADLSAQDIVFLCPKSQDLPELASSIQPGIDADTLLIPVVNGIPWWYFEDGGDCDRVVRAVDPGDRLRKLLPSRQVLGSVTMVTAERKAPGFVETFNPLRFALGEIRDRSPDRATGLAELMSRAGIETRVEPRIRDAVWTKVLLNLISNPLSVSTGATLRQIFKTPQLAEISRCMLSEALPVAKACGARIAKEPADLLAIGGSMGDVKTSMLQDYERGAALELGSICEAVMELAHGHGIEMPTTRIITNLARYCGSVRAHAQAA